MVRPALQVVEAFPLRVLLDVADRIGDDAGGRPSWRLWRLHGPGLGGRGESGSVTPCRACCSAVAPIRLRGGGGRLGLRRRRRFDALRGVAARERHRVGRLLRPLDRPRLAIDVGQLGAVRRFRRLQVDPRLHEHEPRVLALPLEQLFLQLRQRLLSPGLPGFDERQLRPDEQQDDEREVNDDRQQETSRRVSDRGSVGVSGR